MMKGIGFATLSLLFVQSATGQTPTSSFVKPTTTTFLHQTLGESVDEFMRISGTNMCMGGILNGEQCQMLKKAAEGEAQVVSVNNPSALLTITFSDKKLVRISVGIKAGFSQSVSEFTQKYGQPDKRASTSATWLFADGGAITLNDQPGSMVSANYYSKEGREDQSTTTAPEQHLAPAAANPALAPTQQIIQSIEPFGFKEGMSKEQIFAIVGKTAVKQDKDDILILTTAPKPHPEFESYLVCIYRATGITKVSGMSVTVSTNGYGEELRSKFSAYETALTTKYGKPTHTYDFLRTGSIWNEPREYMMGLLKNERTLAAVWELLPGLNIVEQADALSQESGYVKVTYEFPSFAAWKEQHDKQKDANF
jgi:hypothetical protein